MLDRNENFALVEVLGEDQYRKFHLPGAINVPVGDHFAEDIKEAVPNQKTPVVVYCADIDCPKSPEAAQKLDNMGYRNVFDYAEGKADWKQAGLPVEGEGLAN